VRLHRYAKVLLLAPPIGGAVLGVAGLALGVGLILGWGRTAGPSAKLTGVGQERASSVGAAGVVMVAMGDGTQPVLSRVREKSGTRRVRAGRDGAILQKAVFQKPMAGDEVG